jgi:deoxycytidylate deaminase
MNKWVQHFRESAEHIATRSKDTNTKVGAVIFDELHGVEVSKVLGYSERHGK